METQRYKGVCFMISKSQKARIKDISGIRYLDTIHLCPWQKTTTSIRDVNIMERKVNGDQSRQKRAEKDKMGLLIKKAFEKSICLLFVHQRHAIMNTKGTLHLSDVLLRVCTNRLSINSSPHCVIIANRNTPTPTRCFQWSYHFATLSLAFSLFLLHCITVLL